MKEVLMTCQIIQTYIVRRAVCNIQTNGLNKIFATLSKEIESNEISKYKFSETVLFILLSKTSTRLMPRNSQFKEQLIIRQFSSLKQSKYILGKILTYETKENIDVSSLIIEHIMPQILNSKWKVDLGSKFNEIHEKNLHLLGNLTLSSYSSKNLNKSFQEKKEQYQSSILNKGLVDYNIWNEEKIKNRGESLAKLACKIWAIPELSEEFSNKVILKKEEYDILENVDATGTKPIYLSIIGKSFSIKSWKEFFIKLCNEICSLDEEKFLKFTKHLDFEGKESRIIGNTDKKMRRAEKLRNNIFIETNLSANDILNYSKLIVEKYDSENIEVRFKLQ